VIPVVTIGTEGDGQCEVRTSHKAANVGAHTRAGHPWPSGGAVFGRHRLCLLKTRRGYIRGSSTPRDARADLMLTCSAVWHCCASTGLCWSWRL
jgi:hypothetical protein